MLRELVHQNAWRRFTIASLLSRLPLSMALVAFVLGAERAGHKAGVGSILAGAMTLTTALVGPWAGRRFDRRELRRALQRSCLMATGALLVFDVLVSFHSPLWALIGAAVALGFTLAGMVAGFRALLFVAVEAYDLTHAHFVESFMVEFGYGVGPVLVTLLVLVGDIDLVLVSMALCFLLSAVVLQRIPPLPPTRINLNPIIGTIRATGFVWLCALGFALSTGFGMVEGSVAPRMASFGVQTSNAGVYLLLLGLGSCIGGIIVSIRPLTPAQPERAFGLLLLAFSLTLLPLALANSLLWFALVLPFASVPLVPLSGLASSLIEAGLGATNRGATFGVYLTFTAAGGDIGVIAAGLLGDLVSTLIHR